MCNVVHLCIQIRVDCFNEERYSIEFKCRKNKKSEDELTDEQMKEQVLNILYYAFGPSDSMDQKIPYHFCNRAEDRTGSRIFTILLVSVWMIFC